MVSRSLVVLWLFFFPSVLLAQTKEDAQAAENKAEADLALAQKAVESNRSYLDAKQQEAKDLIGVLLALKNIPAGLKTLILAHLVSAELHYENADTELKAGEASHSAAGVRYVEGGVAFLLENWPLATVRFQLSSSLSIAALDSSGKAGADIFKGNDELQKGAVLLAGYIGGGGT